ncbi:beta-glucuronosyltransferase GlcAT14B-like isoform X2 [Phalaenopsis equestris]|uniref:beta-glucuronosyltransferase GlcAT14B-like isoform X2 n=1 Tax=Phalaenopsis equestris TaxID=78828 RepID=UPI0009E6338E|nr:beta-glucuronosyltransferase GlcAT14B-like isoform X2 [Phalaenopsis equestris]
MRNSHRPAAINGLSHRKEALTLFIGLPILAFFVLLPAIHRGRTFPTNSSGTLPFSGDRRPPKLAYLISFTRGEGRRVKRLLRAVYHPWNYYFLHVDLAASAEERQDMKEFVGSEPVFVKFGNVRVMANAEVVTVKGPTVLSSMLHASAILLREVKDWSWFINLDAADYPLISQDDLLHILSFLPRDLNFVEHTSNIGWKEHQRARPIIVDPGLYGSDKRDVFWVKDKRSLPSSFKLFVGSSSVILSWPFLEFCILGWDNLPRTLLMYYTNFLSSIEGYFHTVICNSMDFQNTTVNHDFRFKMWNEPPRQSPMNLTLEHFRLMVDSGAPFARTFVENSPVLDQIDLELLKKSSGRFTPGGWCLGSSKEWLDPCSVLGEANVIRPTAGSRRLEGLLLKLLDAENFRPRQCK